MPSAGPRDRYYSAPPGVHNVGMMYAWGPALTQTGGANIVTGNYAPVQLDSSGNLLVSLGGSSAGAGVSIQGGNTIPVWVSGALTFTGTVTTATTGVFTPDNSTVVSAISTGNAYLASISGKVNTVVPTSGAIQGGNLLPVYVTGAVISVVTGTVTTSFPNPVGVTGTRTDINPAYSGQGPWPFLSIGGRVTNPSGAGSVTGGYSTGQYVILNFAPNGAPYINQGILDRTQDEVTAWPAGSISVSNDVLSGAFGVALSSNANRKQWFIQNLATGGLLVRYSASLPTASVYNMVLKGGSNVADGLGASYSDSIYRGPVSVTGQGGAPLSYTIWEVV